MYRWIKKRVLQILYDWHDKESINGFKEYHTIRKNLQKTLDFANIHYYLVNVLKFTKYLVNIPKFTKYIVNS